MALSFVLTLAPHTAPLVHRFFAAAGLPLARFDTLSCAELAASPEESWEHARTLSRAALRLADAAAACGDGLLQRAVGAAACCSTALRLACHPDKHVRFAAARLAAAGLMANALHAEALRRRCLTVDEVRHADLHAGKSGTDGWLPDCSGAPCGAGVVRRTRSIDS